MEPNQPHGLFCFAKKLSSTDVRTLEIPKAAEHLPPGDGVMFVKDQNRDPWRFRAGTRPNGTRYLKEDWGRFSRATVLSKDIDTLRFYFLGGNNYRVEIHRIPPVEYHFI